MESLYEDPKSLFMKVKARNIIFDGFLIDCTKKDLAAQLVCQEIHERHEDLNLREVNRNVYSMSLWGEVSNSTFHNGLRIDTRAVQGP